MKLHLVCNHCQYGVCVRERRNTGEGRVTGGELNKVWRKKWKEGARETRRRGITERRNDRMRGEGMRCGERQEEAETKREFDMWLIDISALRCGV